MKVIVNGAQGRMGQETVKALSGTKHLECVATLGRDDDLAQAINRTQADIVIDFTTPDHVYQNTKLIIELNVHPVIGTTGLTAAQIQACQDLAEKKQLGGIIAPNFSLGAILMMQFAKQASRHLKDVEIIELHHPKKLDAPSGTAIKTAQLIAENSETTVEDIPIHSVRLPGFVASQQVIFGGQSESLTLQHHTLDRSCFMPGVILACNKVTQLKQLVYGLESLID